MASLGKLDFIETASVLSIFGFIANMLFSLKTIAVSWTKSERAASGVFELEITHP